MRILAIALFSFFASTRMNAHIEVGGTCTNWDIESMTITCAASQCICFGITDDGDLYFPDLGVVGSGFGAPVQIGSETWRLTKK